MFELRFIGFVAKKTAPFLGLIVGMAIGAGFLTNWKVGSAIGVLGTSFMMLAAAPSCTSEFMDSED